MANKIVFNLNGTLNLGIKPKSEINFNRRSEVAIMRWAIIEKFEKVLQTYFVSTINVAIVGGSSKDPEVLILQKVHPGTKITYLGIDNYGNENPWLNLDLNKPFELDESFDLVVCSQVIEHLWNLEESFKSLAALVSGAGYIWINCPASNIAHGSPEYFSAGYSPEYLQRNFERFGFDSLISGSLGSQRYYKATHLLRLWSTKLEHSNPVFGYRISGKITLGKLREMISRIPGRIMMATWNKNIVENIDYSTETYYFGRKR
jgi:SAM-dependent methyltransferase